MYTDPFAELAYMGIVAVGVSEPALAMLVTGELMTGEYGKVWREAHVDAGVGEWLEKLPALRGRGFLWFVGRRRGLIFG